MEKLKQLKTLEDKDILMLQPFSQKTSIASNLSLSATVGLVPTNKKTILHGKLPVCESNFQMRKSLKISGQVLTSKEKDLKPFWTEQCSEISSHLLSHTEIDCVDLGLNLSNTLLTKMVEKSWFSTKMSTVQNKNLPQIYYQYFTSFLAECKDYEDILAKSCKIRVYPSSNQKRIFDEWFGARRYYYNKAVEYLKTIEKTRPSWMDIAKNILKESNNWSGHIPYQIKKMAIKEACDSFTNNKKKVKKLGGHFELKFISKKHRNDSCYIPKSALSNKGVYYTISGILRITEALPEIIKDSRLVMVNGRYYICIPTISKTIKSESQAVIVAIDPGIRNFITFFGFNEFGQFGLKDISRIQRLCDYLDKLISKRAKSNSKRKPNISKAIERIRCKISDLVDELQWKTINFLIKNFSIIVYPTFNPREMVLKSKRKIRSKSARQMLTWSFGKFISRLEHKCFEYGRTLVRISEAYTSKTNSFNGELMSKLGGKEKFLHEGIWVNRDINGARNILIRALVDTPIIQYMNSTFVNES